MAVTHDYTEDQKDALTRHNVATRCFLETGDDDYMAARLSYRAALAYPFLWSSLQAIEKYLKCILLLNNTSTLKLGHDIQKALERINQKAPFKITLEKVEQEFFDHVATYGHDRYLVQSYYIYDRELPKLDMLVWHLRQYCRVMNFEAKMEDGTKRNMLQPLLKMIEENWKRPSKAGHLPFGKLEKILAKKNHPSRPGLIWKNLWYSSSRRKTTWIKSHTTAVNAPLYLDPSLLPRIEHLVYISPEQKEAFKQLWTQQQAKKKSI